MKHQPVLLQPVIDMLRVNEGGIYVDATFGRGGHAAAILERLNQKGKLFAIDQDPIAIEYAEKNFKSDTRFKIKHGSFTMLTEFCKDWGISNKVNGLLLDLGVSSPQLEDPSRGFSFMHDGPLDMRMDTSVGQPASAWLADSPEKIIADVLWSYGEERYAKRIAKKIIEKRAIKPIVTTKELADLVCSGLPRRNFHKHPATRTFQAIRIFVNDELKSLEAVLHQAVDILSIGGRLVVISFHSLEDRIVKRFFRNLIRGSEPLRNFPIELSRHEQKINLIGKPVRPSDEEVERNPRARSAIMRVVEKIA